MGKSTISMAIFNNSLLVSTETSWWDPRPEGQGVHPGTPEAPGVAFRFREARRTAVSGSTFATKKCKDDMYIYIYYMYYIYIYYTYNYIYIVT
jgi:hypothetical protein